MNINEPNEDSRKSAPRRSPHPAHQASGNDSTNQIIKEILEKDNFDNVNVTNAESIVKELKKIQTSYQNQSDYMNADIVNSACLKVRNFLITSKFNEIQTMRASEIEEKLDTTRNTRNCLTCDWNELISAAEERRDDDLLNLQQSFEQELAIFDEQYNEEPNPRFVKSSPELLNLRHRQRLLTVSKHFLEAKAVKTQADELEEIEKLKQKQCWASFLDGNRAEIIDRQRKQMDLKAEVWEKQIAQMRRTARKEIRNTKKAEDHFEVKFDQVQSMVEFPEVRTKCTTTRSVSQKFSMRRSKSQRIERPLINDRQKMFRQRQIMNHVTYTRVSSPRAMRPNV